MNEDMQFENQENSSISSNLSTQNLYESNSDLSSMRSEHIMPKGYFAESINDRDLNTKFGAEITRSLRTPLKPQSESISIRNKPKPSNYESKKSEDIHTLNAFECLKNKKSGQRTYIELEKEHCELPHISLVDTDENLILDYGVKIRYGDAKSFSEASRELESYIMKDFPLETFLQKTEILNATLDIMVSTIDQRTFHNSVLILSKFVDNSVDLYKFLLNPYNRF
jgi:hypothetical protein